MVIFSIVQKDYLPQPSYNFDGLIYHRTSSLLKFFVNIQRFEAPHTHPSGKHLTRFNLLVFGESKLSQVLFVGLVHLSCFKDEAIWPWSIPGENNVLLNKKLNDPSKPLSISSEMHVEHMLWKLCRSVMHTTSHSIWHPNM
mmetsp:Transcript_16708/g.25574  ORF Transcript_16708/g.25574 Transcript_16708/m.25574 type:complete len:141 (+) Transcript_16708:1072-1494(+)